MATLPMRESYLSDFLDTRIFTGPDKRTLLCLRWAVIIASFCLLAFAQTILLQQEVVFGFALLHVFSNAALYFVKQERVLSFRFFSGLVIFDTLALSLTLLATGQLGSDLYMIYFLIIIIGGFWQDLRWSIVFGILISLLYIFLLFVAENPSTYLFLRVPFLFLASVFFGYCAQLIRAEHALRVAAETAARMDFLTGLPNRRAFDEYLKTEMNRAIRYGRHLSLLIIDIDNFKSVNDSLGHQWGDRVLQEIASILKRNVREPDFIARFGGEEFAVILPETELAGAVQAGNRLRLQIGDQAIETPKGLLVITVSVGATSNAASECADLERIYSDADRALYVAKHNGKNQVAVIPGRSLEQPELVVLN